jgi:hypothetical protein
MNPTLKVYLFFYIATIFYVLAQYYHLSFNTWSLKRAFTIAIPLVIIEYYFSLTANYEANSILKMNPVQILLITMTFYFINTWLFNYFILKNDISTWREILSFVLIIGAFMLSSNIKIIK